jgi:hypothetical protein
LPRRHGRARVGHGRAARESQNRPPRVRALLFPLTRSFCNRGREQPTAAIRQLLPVVHCGSVAAGLRLLGPPGLWQFGRPFVAVLTPIQQAT